ncbi:transcriptional regulator, AraC family [Halopseudomonas xinjiangensis]|uniref:Transcriptional regulator, AraC family n=1 Tax=Halopseudomonas xinjiangensis TaxID=487184 RepID=A0A1H1S8F1_9GAMM|nr:AraC family transcriptional regulator [Halopseudomonas xinjiangensis]SDS44232.1 transcriptional regulator, AraC family [Halopseudomonas xinjiangensis]
MKLGDLSVGYLYSLRAALEYLGHDPAPLFQRFAVADELLAKAEARISIPRFMRLGNAAIQLSGQPAIGLWMGRHSHASHLGLPGMAASSAPTLGAAFATLTRFERLTSQNYRGHSAYVPPALRFYSISPYNQYNLFVVDSALSSRATIALQLTGGRARLREVHIEFPEPDYADAYAQFFPCPVLFGQAENQLVWEPSSLELPLIQTALSTHAELVELCIARLERLSRVRRLRDRVADIVSPELHQRLPTLSEVARKLGQPSWTLRRRLLAEDNVRFQEIIDETRRDLALSYIRDTEMALGEVAFLLGFSSPAAFQRAFRRWTGQAPGGYRREFRRSRSEAITKEG